MVDAARTRINAIDRLADLVVKSLVVADVSGAQSRFRLLDTTRAYAIEQLEESSERDPVARRHAEYYHQRSNIETAIMMWKTSFGDGLRSKTETEMKNEVYCKLICHNLSCLIKAMYELGLGAEFLAASFQKETAD